LANVVKLQLETVQEGLRFLCRTEGGPTAVSDSGPGRIAPSPVEMLLFALAGCHGMDVISILRKKRQSVAAYAIEVSGDRRDEHPKSFTRIEIVHRFAGKDLNPKAIQEAIDLSHHKYCSVHASLDPRITVVNRFEIEAASGDVARRAGAGESGR
jgi:putative redox protein